MSRQPPVTLGVAVMRSEGQLRFVQIVGSLAAIAARLQMRSAQSVADWRTGRKVPSQDARVRIEREFGIAVDLWSVLPGGLAGADPDSEPDDVDTAPLPSSLDMCLAMLRVMQRDRQRDLVPSERSKLADAEARLIALRARLEEQVELSEDRYVRDHPAWKRFCDLVLEALEPYPDAARAVHVAIVKAIKQRDQIASR